MSLCKRHHADFSPKIPIFDSFSKTFTKKMKFLFVFYINILDLMVK